MTRPPPNGFNGRCSERWSGASRTLALLVFFAWVPCRSNPACATVLSPSDIERLTGLEQEMIRLDQDILYAANAGNPHTSECLEAMHQELSNVQSLAFRDQ
jgi:hypothetical protein